MCDFIYLLPKLYSLTCQAICQVDPSQAPCVEYDLRIGVKIFKKIFGKGRFIRMI